MASSFRLDLLAALRWYPELGLGYFPVADNPYDEAYFSKYATYAATDMGKKLTQARVALVRRFFAGRPVDIGIGSGQFVEAMDCDGFDVNPAGRAWLRERGSFVDPYRTWPEAVTCWDSLEHIAEPWLLLDRVKSWAFVSLPIFDDVAHQMRSKHFRRDEHYWYFTDRGFERFAESCGFEIVSRSRMESDLGREDIGTYVLKRASR